MEYSRVKGGVKVRQVCRVGQDIAHNVDDCEAGGVVKRRQIRKLLEIVVGRLIDDLNVLQVAALHNAMTGVANIIFALELWQLLVLEQPVKYVLECAFLVFYLIFELFLLSGASSASRIFELRGRRGQTSDFCDGEIFHVYGLAIGVIQ